MRDVAEPRPQRVLMPRAERAATVLLEVCDLNLVEALVALLVTAEAHERTAA
jgi:hypothetical protein